MTNFEKHFDDLYTADFAVVNGDISVCKTTPCSVCEFSERNTGTDCYIGRMAWLKAEYNEAKISVPADTPIDAKILVSEDGVKWDKGYYAGVIDGRHSVWSCGATSWSARFNSRHTCGYMKLYNEEDK